MQQNIAAGRKIFAGFDDYTFYADLMVQTNSETYEAFKDFRCILADYPDAILLLNTRDRGGWVRSRLKHGHGTFLEMTMAANGFASEAECVDFWEKDWDRHLADVRGYMADKPDQLVEFDMDSETAQDLVARFPRYKLNAEAWDDVGRSRGRTMGPVRTTLKRLNAARRVRR